MQSSNLIELGIKNNLIKLWLKNKSDHMNNLKKNNIIFNNITLIIPMSAAMKMGVKKVIQIAVVIIKTIAQTFKNLLLKGRLIAIS